MPRENQSPLWAHLKKGSAIISSLLVYQIVMSHAVPSPVDNGQQEQKRKNTPRRALVRTTLKSVQTALHPRLIDALSHL